jgi:hypothetical protein
VCMQQDMQPDILHIEAFSDNLRGKRILQYIRAGKDRGTPIIDRAEADSADAFARKVLITAGSRPSHELLRTQWNVHYSVSDPKEWILIVTYIVNAPKPLCVVCEDGAELPDIVMKKLASVQGVTIICQRMMTNGLRGLANYDALFFPAIDDIGGNESAMILQALNMLCPGAEDRREWLKELRVAGAGLVWSRQSGISWYDPVETIRTVGGGSHHTVDIISGYLRILADSLSGSGGH